MRAFLPTYCFLLLSVWASFCFAQTPYDSFSPETTRPMVMREALCPDVVPTAFASLDTIPCVAVIDLQRNTLLLVNLRDNSTIGTAPLTDEIQKWLFVDPLTDKNISTSPYMYCNGNPMIFVDPIGLDTLHFDSNGLFSKRIKSDGEHVGIIHNSDGSERNFSFLNQSDADRFCKEGSLEDIEMRSSQMPVLYGIQQVSAKTINKLTLTSVMLGAAFSKKYMRMLYAGFSSLKGGRMDYNRDDESIMKLGSSRGQVMMYLVEGSNFAQDSYNFGNMLWGQAMRQLGISPVTALLGAQAFTLFIDSRHEFDSWDDQRSIILGYFYCITRHF